MKSISAIILTVLLLAMQIAATPNDAVTTLHIEGMKCRFCALVVRIVAKSITGVDDAKVSRSAKSAVITYDASKMTAEELARTLTAKLARWTPPGGKTYSATVAR